MKLDLDKAEQFASVYSLGHELKMSETHEQFQVTTEMSLENNDHVFQLPGDQSKFPKEPAGAAQQ